MRKILIFGANGMTGWELAQRAPGWQLDVAALSREEADITDARAVEQAVTRPPTLPWTRPSRSLTSR